MEFLLTNNDDHNVEYIKINDVPIFTYYIVNIIFISYILFFETD